MTDPDVLTRVTRPADLGDGELAERIALFGVVSRHARAATVLEGLTKPNAEAARRMLEQASSWSSAKRQARAAIEFGNRGDQHERLSHIVGEAPPVLRLAMCAQMTPAQQARFPKLAGREFRRLPGRDAFAARLVREASR